MGCYIYPQGLSEVFLGKGESSNTDCPVIGLTRKSDNTDYKGKSGMKRLGNGLLPLRAGSAR